MVVSVRDDWSETLLELLNTTPVVDGTATDVLDDAWLAAHGAGGLEEARAVRDDVQRVVRGEAAAAVLTAHVATLRMLPTISGGGVDWAFDGPVGWGARMVLAWGELERARPGRLRPCANDECHLFLLDRSRGGTGRWCSMSGCGNRMKARRHYGRTAGAPSTTAG